MACLATGYTVNGAASGTDYGWVQQRWQRRQWARSASRSRGTNGQPTPWKQGKKANVGSTKAEWQCSKCIVKNFMDRTHCRGCGKQRGQGDAILRGNQNLTNLGHGVPKTGPGNQHGSQPASELQAAQAVLASAQSAGFPAEILQMLQAEVEQKRKAKSDSRPLGARIDSAKARVARAANALEKSAKLLATATERVESAERECSEADAELVRLTAEAADSADFMDATEEAQITAKEDMGKALFAVLQAVEQTWVPAANGAVPEKLASVLCDAHAVMTRYVRIPDADSVDSDVETTFPGMDVRPDMTRKRPCLTPTDSPNATGTSWGSGSVSSVAQSSATRNTEDVSAAEALELLMATEIPLPPGVQTIVDRVKETRKARAQRLGPYSKDA